MKSIKYILVVILIVFLLVSICGIIRMHIKYPNPTEHQLSMNEVCSIDNCELTITDCSFFKLSDFCAMNDIDNYLVNIEEKENVYACVLTVKIHNVGTEIVKPELYQMYLGDITCTTGLDLDFFMAINNNDGTLLNPTLNPRETLTVDLPFTLYGTMWGYNEGYFVNNLDLELTVSLYPDKYVIKVAN